MIRAAAHRQTVTKLGSITYTMAQINNTILKV